MTHMCLKDNRIKRMKSLVIRNEQKKNNLRFLKEKKN